MFCGEQDHRADLVRPGSSRAGCVGAAVPSKPDHDPLAEQLRVGGRELGRPVPAGAGGGAGEAAPVGGGEAR